MSTVLFIDDQVSEFRALLSAVQNYLLDVEIQVADSGMAGLELAQKTKPDLIFLDISMPGMDGFEVCSELNHNPELSTVPVIFLSSLVMTLHEHMDALDLGAVDFIRKPISAIELATRINVMLRLSDYTNNLEQLVKKQTEEIEKQQAIAARTERLAAMGTLATGIAHEINQPLNALKVTVDGLLYWKERDQIISEKEIYTGLEFISQQSSRIDKIITHMRNLVSSTSPDDLSKFDPKDVIEQALILVGTQIKEHQITVRTTFDSSIDAVLGHSSKLEQAIINLLINAMRALDKALDQLEKKITINVVRLEDKCQIQVIDNGPGIEKEHIEQIFNPFFTSDDSGQGMGLGLSITQNLISSMSCRLTVENNEDYGARFIITMPIVKETINIR